MDRNNAVEYLRNKDKLPEQKFTAEQEQLIDRVQKEGKIFGDPVVELAC